MYVYPNIKYSNVKLARYDPTITVMGKPLFYMKILIHLFISHMQIIFAK